MTQPGARAVVLLLSALARPAAAHLPFIHPQLVDLVQRSEVILIGTVTKLTTVSPSLCDTTVTVSEVLVGRLPEKQLAIRGPRGLAPDERYVLFVHRSRQSFESTAPSGTIFPAPPADDARYRSTIRALAAALHTDPAGRPAAFRAALVPALSAAAAPLRYHAALELLRLAHDGHGPTEAERLQLSRLLAAPGTDPALRPLLSSLVREPPGLPRPSGTATLKPPGG